jgi:hypothetical protein
MTHTYLRSGSGPTAIITSHNSERKIYQGNTVYLNDGDNFEIRLFNPLSEKIGVEIRFNDQKKSNQLLVMNPGQDYILDRFIEEQRKMIFDTYLINGDNPDAVSAAANNGKVEILFYKEKIRCNPPPWNSTNWSYTSVCDSTGGSSQTTYKSSNLRLGASDSITYYNSSNENIFTDGELGMYKSLDESSNDLETGRVEKGDHSNQNFQQVEIEFETYPFHTITYWLKPTSTKPIYTRQIKHHCSKCGARIKEKYNFCPVCGLDLRKNN